MSAITVSTEVNRSASDVFGYATDPSRFSEWQKGLVDGHLEGTSAPTVGTKCLTTRRIGFSNRRVTSELTHIDPPKTWGVRGIDGPIRATVDLTVEPLADARSRLTIAVSFEGRGIGRVLVPLVVQRQAIQEMPDNLAALKTQLEQGSYRPA
ncbi:MAG: SRPBCC family protein [Acidimicrobiales bacterium]